ncbi:MAG: sporulation membrane protein YtaF [Bacillota bacterium]
MTVLSMILFALAVSVDGFAVGLAYGMRNIIIPFHSLIIICCASSIAIAISMIFGKMLTLFVSLNASKMIGALILVIMGMYMAFQAFIEIKQEERPLPRSKEMLFHVRIPPLGILIQILKEPSRADFDQSGIINLKEACILGFALAMDALGAGFAVAAVGFPPLWTAVLVGVCKFFLVSVAVKLGKQSSSIRIGKNISFVPGLVLLLLGLSKLR